MAVSVMVSEGKTMASDGMEVDSGKGWCRGTIKGTLGFRERGNRVREKMRVFLALSRTTLRRSGATSRRSREEGNKRREVEISRRDVPEKCKTNVATFKSNVATL